MAPPPQTLLLASSNPGKLAELRAQLADLAVRVVAPSEVGFSLPEVIEDGESFLANATKKALSATRAAAAAGRRDLWALADDSGLAVTALGGAPGLRSARYAATSVAPRDGDRTIMDRRNVEHLLDEMHHVASGSRHAHFICALVLTRAEEILATVEGTVEGHILDQPRGESGFGYDPVFFHPPSGVTFAELDPKAKALVSHRGVAMRRLCVELGRLCKQPGAHG